VLLILDEIATNFGRTGSLFAYEQADICPDIITLGKALTGGYMSLAATMCTERVAHGIGNEGAGVLMHGPTFMANPLACRIAVESIDLLLASNWQSQVEAIELQLQQELAPCRELNSVKEVRVKGAIGVIELVDKLDKHMTWLPKFIIEHGVWIRPFSNLLYIMPPFVIRTDQLSLLTNAMYAIAQKLEEVNSNNQ
jgi:adenosylmethionine-8-amino-7-oxononanoate aminotransferase